MGAKFKIGQAVKQVMPAPIAGVVSSLEFNGDDVQYVVNYKGVDGEDHVQPFIEEELEAE
jgi:hypothetical protein